MNWVPLFGELTESSLWDTPLHVRVAWVSLFSKMDFRTFTVRTNKFRLSRLARITVEEADDALKVLTAPDPETLTQAQEGRRLLKVNDETYLFVNGKKYHDLMRAEKKASDNAKRQAEFRDRKKDKPIEGETQGTKAIMNGDDRQGDYWSAPKSQRQEPPPQTTT